MDNGFFRCLFVLCGMMFLARADVISVEKTHPPGEATEGDLVSLRCTVSNSDQRQNSTIDWLRYEMGNYVAITQNGESVNPRYTTQIDAPSNHGGRNPWSNSGTLNITQVAKTTFVCQDTGPSGLSLGQMGFNFPVRYFPSEAFPICSPSGLFVIFEGENVDLSCTTDTGSPLVQVRVADTNAVNVQFNHVNIAEGLRRLSARLNVSAANDEDYFVFTITSPVAFPGLQRDCTIGPMFVIPIDTATVTTTTTTDDYGSSVSKTIDEPPRALPVTWIAVSATLSLLLITALLTSLFLIIRHRHHHPPPKNTHEQAAPEIGLDTHHAVDNEALYLAPQTQQPVQTAAGYFLAIDDNSNDNPEYATVIE